MPWLAALPLLVLLAVLVALPAINRFRPDFRSTWLLSVAASLISLFILFYLRIRLPIAFELDAWIVNLGAGSRGALWQFDSVSLPFAIAVLTLFIATVTASIRRAVVEEWPYWLPGLGLVAASLLSVMAANPLALALSWTLLDGLLLFLGLLWLHERPDRQFLLHRFGIALLSIVLVLGSAVVNSQSSLASLEPLAALLLFVAAGLRLGALPFNPNLAAELDLPTVQWVQLRILPGAASLALLARLDLAALTQPAWLLPLLWLGALYAAAMWLRSTDVQAGLPYWLAGMASLALAATLSGAPLAAQAAGLAWLLAGGLLALSSLHQGLRWPLVVVGVLTLGALPFTPSYGMQLLYHSTPALLLYAFLLTQAMLLFGWLRHVWPMDGAKDLLEPWGRAIALGGLFALPLVHLLFALGLAPELAPRNLPPAAIIPVALLWLLAGLALLLSRRGRIFPNAISSVLENLFSLRWLFAAFRWLAGAVEAIFDFLSGLLEGEAGLLWALLTITLLLSLILQLAVEA